LNGRLCAPTRSAPSSSASAAGSCIPSTSRGRVHRQGQGQRTLGVRRQGLDRHHQCPRARRPVRAARQNATGQPL
jgi:hypothetical protein